MSPRQVTVLRTGAQKAVRWWTSELAGMVPDRLKRQPADAVGFKVEVETDQIVLTDAVGAPQPIGRIVRTPGNVQVVSLTDRDEIHIEAPGAGTRIELALSQVLRKTIELPPLNLEDALKAAKLALPRELPLEIGYLYVALRTEARVNSESATRVTVCAARRDLVDGVISLLKDLGLVPKSVIARYADDTTSPELCPALREQSQRAVRRAALSLCAAAVALLFVGVWSLNHRLDQMTAAVDADLAKVRPQTEELAKKRQEVDAAIRPRAYLNKVLETPSLPDILDNLSILLPETTWVNEFRMQGGVIQLLGRSSDFEPVVPKVEASPLFADVKIAQLTQGRKDGDGQAFSLQLTLARQDGRQ